ncbi:hypothetical protein HMPREF0765_2822 [Sphingobacterium spiritivorum ATCC 33300]|uniref:YtxH-like protein n=2 Tax=Sphingobacterium spiritivorum TaxID=258 RepID=A0A380BWJ2_SPHSI|nr:YtxH domain-containing protein [Sphingobacterium spiritivorum]EEI91512.1 hypothetical protein HMPREF0765_2822 [Sphingobacterium spiritivorum ATCC 33300]QQS97235.1 YtxH domain-containing protein [Sphingobacterium spiritivorum]SUJ08336.1 YtxH-like protein [Sphingobacterium spiritivorum]
MKNKNGILAFALLGLAAGTAAYYLLATEDGKKQMDRANDGIKSLTKSLKDLSKKEAKRASKFAQSAKDEIMELKGKAKDLGKDLAEKASSAAHNMANKVDEGASKAKSNIDNA